MRVPQEVIEAVETAEHLVALLPLVSAHFRCPSSDAGCDAVDHAVLELITLITNRAWQDHDIVE